MGPRATQALLPFVQFGAAGGGDRQRHRALAHRSARVSARDHLRVRQVGKCRIRAHAGDVAGTDVRGALALERDAGACDFAHARGPQSAASIAADACRRFNRGALSGSGGVPRESHRTDSYSRPRAGARNDRQLLARSDGSRRADRDTAEPRSRRHPHGHDRHAGAVAVLSRDFEREPVCVSG